MDRYARILLGLILVGATAACAAATDESAAPSDPVAAATATPRTTTAPSPTPHEMGDMGNMGGHDMGDMSDEPAATVTVDIANFAFAPAELRIEAGTAVTFTNRDSAPHTATAGTDADPMGEVFDAGLLEQGKSFTVVFEEPGTYAYFCERHPPMTGVVVVEG